MISPSMVLAEFTEQQAANRARVTSEINRLKRAVIAPLRHHGIASVEVAFDAVAQDLDRARLRRTGRRLRRTAQGPAAVRCVR